MMDRSFYLSFTSMLQTCGCLVIAHLFSRTKIFLPFMHVAVRFPHRMAAHVVFSLFCIMGTHLGLQVDESIADTRAIGAVLGGMLGGPVVGFSVGLTGGLHRYRIGGPTAFACTVSTIVEGLIGGFLHLRLVRNGRLAQVFHPLTVVDVTDKAGPHEGETCVGDGGGIGMKPVVRRLEAHFGLPYGVHVRCERNVATHVSLGIPLGARESGAA